MRLLSHGEAKREAPVKISAQSKKFFFIIRKILLINIILILTHIFLEDKFKTLLTKNIILRYKKSNDKEVVDNFLNKTVKDVVYDLFFFACRRLLCVDLLELLI